MSARFDTIVVAVDFSETSTEAWHAACRLAEALGSHVHLFHASPDPLQQAWTVESIGVDFQAIGDTWRAQAESRIAAMEPDPPLPPDRITRVVKMGVAHKAIVDYASTHHAGLIVLGTHGYGPFKHFLLGSVAERVLREAPCPVVTVPHRERRAAMVEAAAETALAGTSR